MRVSFGLRFVIAMALGSYYFAVFKNTQLLKQQSKCLGAVDSLAPALHSKKSVKTKPKFAYVFVIVGCSNDPQNNPCLGYILNAVVAAQILHTHASQADVVLMVRMSSNLGQQRLPKEQEAWLRKANIRVAYLPTLRVDNFGTAVLEKFRILELVEYDRVLFFDSDIIPFCNMDYAMQESYRENGILSDYVGVTGAAAPITAAVMLMTPREGLFPKVLKIIQNRPNQTTFDRHLGWGHVIPPEDAWESSWRKNTTWDFKAGASDQGILLYLLKYQLLNYTQIFIDRIDTWREVTVTSDNQKFLETSATVFPAPDGKYITRTSSTQFKDLPKLGCKSLLTPFDPRRHRPGGFVDRNVENALRKHKDNWWYLNYHHFAHQYKAWRLMPITNRTTRIAHWDVTDPLKLWFYHLGMANQTLGLQLPDVVPMDGKDQKINGKKKNKQFNPLGLSDSSKEFGMAGGQLFGKNVELPKPGGWEWADLSS